MQSIQRAIALESRVVTQKDRFVNRQLDRKEKEISQLAKANDAVEALEAARADNKVELSEINNITYLAERAGIRNFNKTEQFKTILDAQAQNGVSHSWINGTEGWAVRRRDELDAIAKKFDTHIKQAQTETGNTDTTQKMAISEMSQSIQSANGLQQTLDRMKQAMAFKA